MSVGPINASDSPRRNPVFAKPPPWQAPSDDAGQLHAMSDADEADGPPSGAERIACIIDSWVPTASITECAPGRW
jgi:hypothetical protein